MGWEAIMKKAICCLLILAWASVAVAHTSLKSTTPANGAIISQTPIEITLNFGKAIRLTRLIATHAGEKKIRLDLSGHNGFIKRYLIPFDGMGAGDYLIEWRGLGGDGHPLNGSFSFTVE